MRIYPGSVPDLAKRSDDILLHFFIADEMAKQTDGAKGSFSEPSATLESILTNFMALMLKGKRTLVEYHDAALLLESVRENDTGYGTYWA